MGTFPLGAVCVACQEPCATCRTSAYDCITCTDGLILNNG